MTIITALKLLEALGYLVLVFAFALYVVRSVR